MASRNGARRTSVPEHRDDSPSLMLQAPFRPASICWPLNPDFEPAARRRPGDRRYRRGRNMLVRDFTLILALSVGSAFSGSGRFDYLLDSRFHVISQGSPAGSFVLLDGNRLLSLSSDKGGTVRMSLDDGNTWNQLATMYDGPGPGRPTGIASIPNVETALALKTQKGVIIWIYRDWENGTWAWDDEKGEATEARRDVWSIRSLDGGKTWVNRHRVFEGYTGALIDIIQTREGQVVVPIQRYLPNPGRHATCTYVSEDDGKTWKRSNIIDFGDQGHHAGAYEGTLTELTGGRLYMLLRTNLDRFWEAFSEDHGNSWRVLRPSSIDASSAPGYLRRLASGRLVLVWNRLYPRGKSKYRRHAGQGSLYRASRHREELSIAFSEDDGKNWNDPDVFVRGERVCYPQIWERRPGEIWVSYVTGKDWTINLVGTRETDLVGPARLSSFELDTPRRPRP